MYGTYDIWLQYAAYIIDCDHIKQLTLYMQNIVVRIDYDRRI